MFKVTSDQLTPGSLAAAVRLASAPLGSFDAPTTHTFGKLKKEMVRAYQEYMEERQKYIDEYCVRDEKGNPKITKRPDGADSYRFQGDNAKKFSEKMEELKGIEFEINCSKLSFKLSEFPSNVLNGDDFMNLEGIVDFVDDTESKPKQAKGEQQ